MSVTPCELRAFCLIWQKMIPLLHLIQSWFPVNASAAFMKGDLLVLNASGEVVPAQPGDCPMWVAGMDIGQGSSQVCAYSEGLEGYFCYEYNFDTTMPRDAHYVGSSLFVGANGKFTVNAPTQGAFRGAVGQVIDTLPNTHGRLPTGIPSEYTDLDVLPNHYMRVRFRVDFNSHTFTYQPQTYAMAPLPPPAQAIVYNPYGYAEQQKEPDVITQDPEHKTRKYMD